MTLKVATTLTFARRFRAVFRSVSASNGRDSPFASLEAASERRFFLLAHLVGFTSLVCSHTDQLSGDNGDDTLVGGNSNDRLYGGLGHDELFGVSGNDVLDVGDGTDRADSMQGDFVRSIEGHL